MPYIVTILATSVFLLAVSSIYAALNIRMLRERVRALEATRWASAALDAERIRLGMLRELDGDGEISGHGALSRELRTAASNAASNALKACRGEHGAIISIGAGGQVCPHCLWEHGAGDHLVCKDGNEGVRRCNACGRWYASHPDGRVPGARKP